MDKARNRKPHAPSHAGDMSIARFEYDRANEKRKVQEEIEDFLKERRTGSSAADTPRE